MAISKINQRKRVRNTVNIDKYYADENNRTYIGMSPTRRVSSKLNQITK